MLKRDECVPKKWAEILRYLLAGIAALGLSVAMAKPANIGEGEMALLPPYCIDTMGFKYGDAYSNPSPRAGHWVGLMGKNFWAMHHYCWALIDLKRSGAAGKTPQERLFHRESAVGDIGYVVKNTSPNFILLPEILTTLGGAYLLLSRVGEANDAFENARKLKPDYWPAYTDWAAFLIKQGQKTEAKALVKTGLEYRPDVKELQNQYRLLGGNPSEIVPIAKPPETVVTPADAPVEPASATSPSTRP
jgi:tetratricopeptide (TPR) repeat protein